MTEMFADTISRDGIAAIYRRIKPYIRETPVIEAGRVRNALFAPFSAVRRPLTRSALGLAEEEPRDTGTMVAC